MDEAFERVLAVYNERLAAEERIEPGEVVSRDDLLLAVGEPVGRFLQALAVARGAKRILELGTSYGYSTLFLAAAARATGGRVLSLDVAAHKQAWARERLSEAGLADHVEFHCGDAVEALRSLAGPFDFILLDIWKDLYIPCLEAFFPKLAENGIIAADNMLYPPRARDDAEAYRAAVRAKPELQSVLLPIGNGIELSCLWRT